MPDTPKSFLVIRRDNIGDLVCTTPVFSALRRKYPDAWIGALVNRYAEAILRGNPDVDEIISYRKAKHRLPGESALSVYWETWATLRKLRKRAIDVVILASPGYQESAERMAGLIRPRHILGFDHVGGVADLLVPVDAGMAVHQVENVFRILRPLGIEDAPASPRLYPDPALVAELGRRLDARKGTIVGVHISAREADRRWSDESFIDLIRRLSKNSTVLLSWAPGQAKRKEFPGDDESARLITESVAGTGIIALPTSSLADLIANISLCDIVICSDGGPVHIAAALGKPVVALFGSERPELWYPWGVPYRLLQKPSLTVADIDPEEVMQAYEELEAGRVLVST